MTSQTFVIVGASLAGAKAAEALRENGFDGRVWCSSAQSPPARTTFYGAQPSQFTTVTDADLSKLETGDMHRVTLDGTPVLLARARSGRLCGVKRRRRAASAATRSRDRTPESAPRDEQRGRQHHPRPGLILPGDLS